MKPNRAVVAVLTIVLALTTALTLVGTAVTLADTPASSSSIDEIAIVHRFYDAVNAALAIGDTAALAASVGPDLTVGNGGGFETLRDHLLALRAARPGLWLRVEEAIAGGDRVVTRVAFDGLAAADSGTTPLAVPAPGSPAWATGDRFRVVAGRIVAFEGIILALGAPRGALDQVVAAPELGQVRLGLARLTVAPGATLAAPAASGPAAYVVERGAVDLRLTDETGALNLERRLGGGDQFAVPTGSILTLHNPSPEQVVLATAALTVPAAPWPPSVGGPSAAEADLPPWLAIQNGVAAAPATDPAGAEPIQSVSLGAATLVPGRLGLTGELRLSLARLTPSAGRNVLTLPEGGPALLAVETGPALVTSTAAPANPGAPESGAAASPTAGTPSTRILAAGEATLAEPGATVAVQAAGDQMATLLLLTLAPA